MLPLSFISIPAFRPNFFTSLLCLLFMALPVVHTSAKLYTMPSCPVLPCSLLLISPQSNLYPSPSSAISQHFVKKGMRFENETVCRSWSSHLSGSSCSHPEEIALSLYRYMLHSGGTWPPGQEPVLEEEQDGIWASISRGSPAFYSFICGCSAVSVSSFITALPLIPVLSFSLSLRVFPFGKGEKNTDYVLV